MFFDSKRPLPDAMFIKRLETISNEKEVKRILDILDDEVDLTDRENEISSWPGY